MTTMNPLTVVYFTALVLGRQAAAAPERAGQAVFVVAVFVASASWQRLAYSSMAPPICRKCRRKVYDGSAARRARYSPKVVCWRRV